LGVKLLSGTKASSQSFQPRINSRPVTVWIVAPSKIVDRIQKVNIKISKDIDGLKLTTPGCDAIRSADTPPIRGMLDRRAERHFMRLLTQKNSNSDPIPHEPEGLVDDEGIPILDSWTERTAEDLWVLGDEVEEFLLVDLEFAPWHEEASIGHDGNCIHEYHEWTMVHVECLQILGGHVGGTMIRGNK
jgi:hypothetical protein